MKTFAMFAAAILAGVVMLPAAALADPRIVLFEHVDYRGAKIVLGRDEPNLVARGFNDIASSIRVKGGTWELCEHVNYGGRCIRVSDDNPNLVPRGFNDIVSSVRLVRDRDERDWGRDRDRDWGRDHDRDWDRDHDSRRADIVLFEHVDFAGDRRELDDDARNLVRLDFNDIVSSIRIRHGVWQVCEHVNYGGRCMTFDHDVRNLVDYGFNDQISSVRRLR